MTNPSFTKTHKPFHNNIFSKLPTVFGKGGNSIKSIALLGTVLSLVLLLNTNMQQAYAGEITYDIDIGPAVDVFFRDYTSFLNETATGSFDAESYDIGQTVTFTISDFNANLDPFSVDEITAVASSGTDPVGITFVLTEDSDNSGVFVGTFTLTSEPSSGDMLQVGAGDEFSVDYEPEPSFAGRAIATFNEVTTAGLVEVSDYDLDASSLCFDPITGTVNFTLNGAEIDPSIGTIGVTMSY